MDVIVIGGGLNGGTLALALATAGMQVTLVEQHRNEVLSDPGFDGRSYALAHASTRLLRVLGVWDAAGARAEPIRQIKVSDGRAGEGGSPLSLLFDGAEIEEDPPGYVLEDRFLRRALLTALATAPGVTHLSGMQVVDHTVSDSGVTVSLSDGRTLPAQMIVGADGMESGVARRAGIRRMEWSYGQVSFSCAIAHDRPHDGTAHQFFMPPGPLAILPLPGNRSSIVWTEAERRAARIAMLDDAEYLALLRPRIGDFLGDFTLAGQRFAYPVPLSIAQSFAGDRVVLIGDAAHRVHPLAGHGIDQARSAAQPDAGSRRGHRRSATAAARSARLDRLPP